MKVMFYKFSVFLTTVCILGLIVVSGMHIKKLKKISAVIDCKKNNTEMMLKRKEFEKLFFPFNDNGKQIWVVTKVKELPKPIIQIALNLAELDFIKYISISDDYLAASSENFPNRPKVPNTKVGHNTAIGVQILYNEPRKYINFFDINSPIKGNGAKMVAAIFADFPTDWEAAVAMDWSDGFWTKMKEKYNYIDWLM